MSQLALLPDVRPLGERLLAALDGVELTFGELRQRLGCGPELALPLLEAVRCGEVLTRRDPPRYRRRT